jgi:hypothetical protein
VRVYVYIICKCCGIIYNILKHLWTLVSEIGLEPIPYENGRTTVRARGTTVYVTLCLQAWPSSSTRWMINRSLVNWYELNKYNAIFWLETQWIIAGYMNLHFKFKGLQETEVRLFYNQYICCDIKEWPVKMQNRISGSLKISALGGQTMEPNPG